MRNTATNLIQGSRLRIAMILFCSAVFWAGLFVLFLGGFQFISLYVDLANTIVEYLFSMFFLSLLVMLFFSSGIIVYTALFHSREAAYLLTTPASTDRIFAYKFIEAVGFSSWGFFLLGSPLMVAYGLTVKAPAGFYGMFLLYLISFVLIPGSVGAVAAIAVANIFPRRQKTVLALSVVGVLVLLVMLGVRLWRTPGDTLSGDWLGSMLNRMAFCQNPLWPSRWMSAGLLASAKGEWSQARYHLMVLSAHAALLYSGGRGRGARPLPPRLQQSSGRTHVTAPARPFLPGRDRASALLLPAPSHPAAHRQRPANLLARSGPVVAILDLLRIARLLLS